MLNLALMKKYSLFYLFFSAIITPTPTATITPPIAHPIGPIAARKPTAGFASIAAPAIELPPLPVDALEYEGGEFIIDWEAVILE